MFWSTKPTLSEDDIEWQLGAWAWLLENLGGIDRLKSLPSKYPRQADFPRSGLSGHAHVEFVFAQVCGQLGVDPSNFELVAQIVKNAPRDPAGTYSRQDNRQVITYEPGSARDLEHLIAVLAHEVCHGILHSIPARPDDWGDNEEFVTDLATVFFGFGLFGGNQSFQFSQFNDVGSGTQGWATRRLGYLTQAEWGFALAVRILLTGEDIEPIKQYAVEALGSHFVKNHRYLSKHPALLDALARIAG
jgi:hypothetical protein